MSFSLAVQSGDLVMSGSQMAIVAGSDKLQQDLTLWMVERYGIDISHPRYGSWFENYIGGIINLTTQQMIESEALRVLNNYQKVQQLALAASPTVFSLSELLSSVNSVNVAISYDTIQVSVSVSNAEQAPVTVSVAQSI